MKVRRRTPFHEWQAKPQFRCISERAVHDAKTARRLLRRVINRLLENCGDYAAVAKIISLHADLETIKPVRTHAKNFSRVIYFR